MSTFSTTTLSGWILHDIVWVLYAGSLYTHLLSMTIYWTKYFTRYSGNVRKLWGIINTQSCKFPGKSAGKSNFENRLRFHTVVAMRFYWDTVYSTGNFDTFKTPVSVNPYCIPIYDQKRICPSVFSQILSPVSDYVIGFLIYFTFR